MAGKGIVAVVVAVAGLLAVAGLAASPPRGSTSGIVREVVDGDTIRLTDGRKIRLVQIDTPELNTGECYSRAAHRVLLRLEPVGTHVVVEPDPALDQVDRWDRQLRYVFRGTVNLNLELVRLGAAAPWFFHGDRGRYAAQLMRAARGAEAARRGLWGACPHTVLDPENGVQTGQSGPPKHERCAASYPDVCVPSPPPYLDCGAPKYHRIRVRWNVPDPDPQHFDGNRDGVGCES